MEEGGLPGPHASERVDGLPLIVSGLYRRERVERQSELDVFSIVGLVGPIGLVGLVASDRRPQVPDKTLAPIGIRPRMGKRPRLAEVPQGGAVQGIEDLFDRRTGMEDRLPQVIHTEARGHVDSEGLDDPSQAIAGQDRQECLYGHA
jgi:hypothetical protein